MRKRVVSVFIIMSLLLISVFTTTILAEEKVTLRFLHRWTQEPDNTFFKEVAEDFEKEHPNIKVEVNAIANDPFKEKIKVILGTENAPDVFFTWPGEFTNRFIRAGHVLDLTPYMEEGWKNDFVQSVLEPFEYQGKIYGTPYRLDAKVFVYNKEIFQKVGIEEPETFEEFVIVCEEIKKAGVTPIAFGNMFPWAISHYIGQINAKCVPPAIYQEDVNPAKGTFTHPGYVKALEKYTQLLPYFNTSPNAIRHDEARARFVNGEMAMMYVEIIEIPEIERMVSGDFNYGAFKFPDILDGQGDNDHLLGYPEGFVVYAGTKHPDLAVEFLKYLTGKEVGKKEAKEIGFVNGIKNVVDEGEVRDAIYSTTQLVLETEKMVNWFDSALHAEIWSIAGRELQKLTDGVTTPEKAMDEIIKAAAKVREQF